MAVLNFPPKLCGRQTWDAQMSFLRSADGVQYDRQLFERFEGMRQKRDEFEQAVPAVAHFGNQ
jgi:hypothetical protein